MEANPKSRTSYTFGDFLLDPGQLMLYRDGEEIQLPPKAVETLVALIERRGEIVSKDDLLRRIWSDSIVEESNLSRYIHMLRAVLGAQSNTRPYIETFRRRGYRFSADVEVERPVEANDELIAVAVQPRPTLTGRSGSGTPIGAGGNVVQLAAWQRESESEVPVAPADEAEPEEPPFAMAAVNPSRKAKSIAIVALLLCSIVAITAYLLIPNHLQPLSEKDTVLIADFENRTGEDVFDGTLKQGLAIHLQQSSFIRLFPEERIRETLKLMRRSPDDRITNEVARQICIRQGLKAYIKGTIVRLGQNYVLTLEALNAQTDELISSEQVEAEGKESVLAALSRGVTGLRVKLGESLASIREVVRPWEVTTVSIEALKLLAEARTEARRGNWVQAIRLAREATTLDPEFASAFRYLAIYYANNGQPELAVDPATTAYELRNRVGKLERLSIEDSYYQFVTREVDKQIEILLIRKQLLPDDFQPSGFLALQYYLTGEYEKSVDEAREAITKGAVVPYTVLSRALVALDRYGDADAAVAKGLELGLDDRNLYEAMAEVAFLRNDYDSFESVLRTLDQKSFTHQAIALRAVAAARRGEVRQSEAGFRKAFMLAERQNARESMVLYLNSDSAARSLLKGDCSATRTLADKALGVSRWDSVLSSSASVLARCGYEAKAKTLLAELVAKRPLATEVKGFSSPLINASIKLRKGDAIGALELLDGIPENLKRKSEFQVQFLRGEAYLILNRGAEASSQFQDIIDHPGEGPFSPLFPLAHLGLARGMVKSGELGKAREAYESFFKLWENADDDLPELIAARAEYQALTREHGWK